MISFRADQVAAFALPVRNTLIDRITRDVAVRHPELLLKMGSDDALRDYVADCVSAAERHGFSRREEVRRFVGFLVTYGPAFGETSETAWARPVLTRRDIGAVLRLDILDSLERQLCAPAGHGADR